MQNSLLKLKKKSPRLPFRKDNNSLRQERLSRDRVSTAVAETTVFI